MLFDFLKNKKEYIDSLLIYIGSSRVTVALVNFSEGKQKIIFIDERTIEIPENLSVRWLSDRVDRILSQILEKNKENIKKTKINKTFVFLSSIWHYSEIRYLAYKNDEGFTVSRRFVDGIVKKDRENFEQEIFKNHKEKGHNPHIIEQHGMGLFLNGYDYRKIANQKTKTFEYSYFISMTEKVLVDKIKNTIAKHSGLSNIYFSSSIFPLVYTISKNLTSVLSFILVKIEGEMTDVVVFKNGELCSANHFKIGKNSFLRELMDNRGLHQFELESDLSIQNNGLLNKKNFSLNDAVNSKKEWLTAFRETISDTSNCGFMPDDIFILSDGSFWELFSEIIKKEDFSQNILTSNNFKIYPIKSIIEIRDQNIPNGEMNFSKDIFWFLVKFASESLKV